MRELPRSVAYVLPALILLTLFLGFFDRPVLFHDEIIHVHKAQESVIFDYAARPAFHVLNYISFSILGDHPLSLSFVMLLVSAAGGWLTFLFAKRHYGYAAGVAALAAYTWLGWVHTIGISAMAHMLPATLALLVLYVYLNKQRALLHLRERVWLSVLLWTMLLSHPTGVAYFVAFFGLVAFDLLRDWRGERVSFRALLVSSASWVLISVAIWFVIEIFYANFSGGSYAGAWLRGLEKTADSKYSKYFQPYWYYFKLFAERLWILIAALLLSLGWLVMSQLVGRLHSTKDGRAPKQGGGEIAAKLAVFSLISLCIVSAQTWKFERVAATFVPIASLALVCVTFYILGRVRTGRVAAKPLLALAIISVSGYIFVQDASNFGASLSRHRGNYSAFMEAIRASESDQLAYVGDWSDKARRRIPVISAAGTGRRLEPVGSWPATKSDAAALISSLEKDRRRHLLVDLGSGGKAADVLRGYLNASGRQRVASYWRGGYELWSLTPLNIQPPAEGLEELKANLADRLSVFLRYDRISTRAGVRERQIYFEVLGSDVEEADRILVSCFESLGYKSRRGWEDAEGIRLAFIKSGLPVVNVLVRGKEVSPPFQRTDGSASVYIRQRTD